jgi:exodeoxyribonuclease VII large subunit
MDTPLSVKRFLEQVKVHLEPRFAHVCLVGEVFNFRSSGKHWYFTLKEEGAALSCAVWMSQQKQIGHMPKDGERVIVQGGLNLYVQGGSVTFVVTKCELTGMGDLQQKLRALEAAFRAEGIFDRPKRTIPLFPKKIAVIAALGGAALQDVLKVTLRRAPGIDIMVFPAAAQGSSCVMENMMALQEAQDEYWGCDAILMVRGGGGLEDLWGYNDPDLARAVSASRVPIITGVGHEIDLTLVDLASDKRAATPSQAAEFATPDRGMLQSELARKTEQLNRHIDWLLHGIEATLNLTVDRGLARLDPLMGPRGYLAFLTHRLERAAPSNRLDSMNVRLSMLSQKLMFIGAEVAGAGISNKLTGLIGRLDSAIRHLLKHQSHTLGIAIATLKGIDPKKPLDMGFVLASGQNGRRIKSSAEAKANDKLRLQWSDGEKWVNVES